MSLKKYLSEAELRAAQPVTGDELKISVNDTSKVVVKVIEHTEGGVLVELDEKTISTLESCGATFEEAQLDEIWPALAAAGGAVARGVGGAVAKGASAAGNAIVKSAATSALKSAGNKVDKAIFGRGVHDDDMAEDSSIEVGDIVCIDYPTKHEGHMGEVVELAPSGQFAYVQFKDDDIESYDISSLRRATEEEEEQYRYGEDFDESLNHIRKLSGLGEANYDKTPMGPYDRGAADAYYGRKMDPHKWVDDPESGVRGARKRVPLTDPEEIAAYEAGYNEAGFGEKDYGSFPDTSDMDESAINHIRKLAGLGEAGNFTDWQAHVVSIPRKGNFKLKSVVLRSPGGKVFTFDNEKEARQHFGRAWEKVVNPDSGWEVDLHNTKPELDEIGEPVLNRYIAKATRGGASNRIKGVTTALAKVNDKFGSRFEKPRVPAGKSNVTKDTFDESYSIYVKSANGIARLKMNESVVRKNGQWSCRLWTKTLK